jgi:hypothetical protein
MKNKELLIPPEAIEDPDSFEIMRVWAAKEAQHVTIRDNLNGGAYDFGYMLAQLLEHGAQLYTQRDGIDIQDARKKVMSGFQDEIEEPSGNVSGSIPTEN